MFAKFQNILKGSWDFRGTPMGGTWFAPGKRERQMPSRDPGVPIKLSKAVGNHTQVFETLFIDN